MLECDKTLISRAKKLRRDMTPRERKLWYEFLREYPIRFQRQKVIGEYIADFYVAKAPSSEGAQKKSPSDEGGAPKGRRER